MQGDLNDKWRYRVGEDRIIVKTEDHIEDHIVVITAVEVGHRKDIFA